MSTLATRIGREAGRPYMPIEIFNISASRENALASADAVYLYGSHLHVVARHLSGRLERIRNLCAPHGRGFRALL